MKSLRHELKDILGPDFEQLFSDIPVPKHPLDDEQADPFTTPDLATVTAARLEVERIKRRNAEATPTPIWPARDGGEI